MGLVDPNNVRIYTVNGATTSSSSSLPDWLTRKREAKGKSKRARKEHVEGAIELIQGFEFPEASNKVKTTRDGHHIIATGTYKPQMRVWDLDQLSLKFERHSDAENVDFVTLSDDWTKSVHLQNDRTLELHTQGGFHYRTRIPRFGRSLAYHFPSCDVYVAATGNEVYRLNLEQGRFMRPLELQTTNDQEGIIGVNVVDINAVHQLLAFGVDGNGTTQLWDPRSRSAVGTLKLPRSGITPIGAMDQTLSVTAIASRVDGLSYAIGTSTGHTLLYDIRAAKPFSVKDQGYGLPIKSLSWIEGGDRMAGDGMVVSADKKVIKIWDRNTPAANFVSITPATDLNDVHHVPGSGLIITANEGIQMATHYIPQLGPAPRWASFLENITEEMEDQTTRTVYEDYKFVERSELKSLGLDHLIGTPALKPYMHGYFLALKLYETARIVANPFAYDEYREKVVREKMEKMAETRIRAKKDALGGVKVNKSLAAKVLKEEERKAKKAERRERQKEKASLKDLDLVRAMDVEEVDNTPSMEGPTKSVSNLLSDPRFAKVFADPAYLIDETSREFTLLNPSSVAQKDRIGPRHTKTAVEEEEEEDKYSSGLGGHSETGSSDEDDEKPSRFDGVDLKKPHSQSSTRNVRTPRVAMVPMRPRTGGPLGHSSDSNTTFGQRRAPSHGKLGSMKKTNRPLDKDSTPMEISWVPSGENQSNEEILQSRKSRDAPRRKGVERFGAGLEKGDQVLEAAEPERHGRERRRQGIRSGSKNTFRRL
ncbi:NUC153 and WD40 repeat-containing nucleolar rRNA processing-related protein [Crepidotus variabilis]|uniref:NUC153 and WD40 repeat-containing nucleolar rRNA processing-related protein n=1 Tax=Crepidotus variabilis TaxID=179855 RepID=A0A9P6EJE1_9AGAR|nr:NUC153 and WD40 repeat-containing nucleolar rRNA processing-related protein [Crepidotus variabilis]